MSNDDDQQLLNQYRSASTQDAGAPPIAIRKAVLAEAAAAARRREPAANDSKYIWRAAAGIGVIGIALLIWRQSAPQLDHMSAAKAETTAAPMTEQRADDRLANATTAPAATATSEAEPAKDQYIAPVSAAVPTTAPTPPMASERSRAAKTEASPRPEPAAPPLIENVQVADTQAAAAAPPAAPPTERAMAGDAAAPEVAAAAPAATSRQADFATAARRSEPIATADQLFRKHFTSATMSGNETNIAWLVLTINDQVVEKGLVSPTANLQALRERLIDKYGAAIGDWKISTARNEQGQSFQIAIARTN
jgi:hypothetical protein